MLLILKMEEAHRKTSYIVKIHPVRLLCAHSTVNIQDLSFYSPTFIVIYPNQIVDRFH